MHQSTNDDNLIIIIIESLAAADSNTLKVQHSNGGLIILSFPWKIDLCLPKLRPSKNSEKIQ